MGNFSCIWNKVSLLGVDSLWGDFEEALNAVKFLGWLKKLGQAQNILGPVKGQDITLIWNHIIGVLLGILLRITVRILLIKPATFAN